MWIKLVSSATATPDTDAFNFLSRGAGQYVFEVFLKVTILHQVPGISLTGSFSSISALSSSSPYVHLEIGRRSVPIRCRCVSNSYEFDYRVRSGYIRFVSSCLGCAHASRSGAPATRCILPFPILSRAGRTSRSKFYLLVEFCL